MQSEKVKLWYSRWCFVGLAQNEEGGRLFWSPGCPSNPTPERPCCAPVIPLCCKTSKIGRTCFSTMLACRWAFQGLVWNELHGMQYPPFSCIAIGMPGASDAQIRQVITHQQSTLSMSSSAPLQLLTLDRQTSC